MCLYKEHVQGGGLGLAMSKYSKIVVHSHVGLSSPFWPIGMPEIDRKSPIHRQTNRLSWCHAPTRRTAGCPSFDYKLFEEVSLNLN